MAESMAEAETRAAATAATGDGDRGSSVETAGGQPPAVKGGATISVTVVLLALLVASVAAFLMSSPHAGERMERAGGEAGEGKQAEPVELAVGDVGIPGFNSRLDAFRTWARLTWMKLRRPLSDEPRYDVAGTGSAGSVADVAKKSFEMGKDTVEQAAAATAAGATGDAVEKTKRKAKGTAASPSSDDAEL